MKVVYIADDGTQFSDQYRCENYEFILKHQNLLDVRVINAHGNTICNLLSEKTYCTADTVIVKTHDAVNDLHELADFTGFESYKTITFPGTWRYDVKTCRYIEYTESAE